MIKQDPYRWAQLQQRKNAHIDRRAEIEEMRAQARGDIVRGIPTPFIESFDSAGQVAVSTPRVDEEGNPLEEPHPLPTSPHILNNLVSQSEFEEAVTHAYVLTKPTATDIGILSQEDLERKTEEHEKQHARAVEAVQRILDLQNGSSKDRRHANIRRCIETFGRHETDLKLPPKALSRGQEREEQPVRGGPDTGSSEVQIAILTVKIKKLADELGKPKAYRDKVNKRNLRLLLHKRQRLLRYMERKERGSPRWQHMVETLGLTEATYKGQISL